MKKKWKAEFLRRKKPYCSIKSIKETEKNTAKLVSDLMHAVTVSRAYVEKYVSAKPTFEELQPMTRARLCMVYFKRQKTETEKINYAKCYWKNIELKKKYKDESGRFEAKINIVPDETAFCIDEKVALSVEYNMRRDNSKVNWEILNAQGEVEEKLTSGKETTWKPKSEGVKLIRAYVEASYMPEGGVLKSKRKLEKKIIIKPESECSKLQITLDASNTTEITEDSQVTITAKVLSLASGNPPVTRYYWFEDGKSMPTSETPTYILSGKGKANKTVTVEAIAYDRNGNLSKKASIKIDIKEETSNSLDIKIISSERKNIHRGTIAIKENETILLKAIVNPKQDSGKLKFRWSVNKKTVLGGDGNAVVFKGKGWIGKKVTVDVIVTDEKNRDGTASLTISVKSSQEVDVEFEKHKNLVRERDNIKLRVKKPKQTGTKKYNYTWKRDGRVVVDKMEFDYFNITNFQGLKGKRIKFSVEVFDETNASIGEADTVIQVVSSKKEDEKERQEKPTTLKITAPSSNQETPETTILVAGEVSHFENVVSMQMIVNGVTYQMKPSAKFSQKMPIVPGKNTLQVTAKLKNGRIVSSQVVTVKSTQSAENRYRFTLRWNTARTDIDLWLEGPTGESCSYQGNSSFAELDRDEREAGYGPENIFIAQLTDYGKYKVRVHYYADHNKEDEETAVTPTSAEVLFFIDNKLSKRWKGNLTSEKQWWDVYSFTYGMDIQMNPPEKTSINIGETLNLTAKVKESSQGLGEMLKGKYLFRWVGDEGVEFSPVDTLKPKTTALFTRPGKVKIHVQVMVKKGNELKAVGKSKDITIDVVGVTYKLKLDPPKPMVGQEAVITVVPDYNIDTKALDIRWEASGSVLRQGLMEAGNTWKYGVTGKASKPITVIAHGRTPFYGDDAGESSVTFTPQLYTVKATKQDNAYGGMRMRVYDPSLKDFVEAPEGSVVTDQTIRLRATIEGEPLLSDIRWKWIVNNGTSISNEISKEPTVMRHESGTIIAKVEARNQEDILLGSDEVSFSVLESDHGPKASQMKLKKAKEAWKEGKIQQAIIFIDEAKKMNQKDTVIQHEFERIHKDYLGIKTLLKKAKAIIKISEKLKEAKKDVEEALKLNGKYKPSIQLRDEIDQLIKQQKKRKAAEEKKIKQLLKKAEKLISIGKLKKAVEILQQGKRSFPNNKEIDKLLRKAQKKREAQKLAEASIKKAKMLWEQGALNQAIEYLNKVTKKLPENKHVLTTLQEMQKQKDQEDSLIIQAEQRIRQGSLPSAESLLSRAAGINNKYPKYLYVLKFMKESREQKEKDQKKVRKLLQKGQQLWNQGELKRAIDKVLQAQKNLQNDQEVFRVLKHMQKQKKDLDAKLKEAVRLIRKRKLGKAERILSEAAKINKRYPEYKKVLKQLADAKKKREELKEKENSRPKTVKDKQPAGSDHAHAHDRIAVMSASGVVGNTKKIIEISLEPGLSNLMKLHITEGSELTYQTNGKQDSARIGEVEFYANGRKIVPERVEADSTFGSGYSINQIIDGDREYRYMTSGAKGWASADKHREAWITFYFDREVDITKVIITTAPTRPYRLYSFSLIKYKNISTPDDRIAREKAELDRKRQEARRRIAQRKRELEQARSARERAERKKLLQEARRRIAQRKRELEQARLARERAERKKLLQEARRRIAQRKRELEQARMERERTEQKRLLQDAKRRIEQRKRELIAQKQSRPDNPIIKQVWGEAAAKHKILGTYTGNLSNEHPKTSQMLTMPEDGTLNIQFRTGKKLNFYGGIHLMDADNKTYLSRDISLGPNSTKTWSFSLLRAGRYYVRLAKDSDSVKNFL